MSSPIPLNDPNGIVRAWMCNCCQHVGSSGESMFGNADERQVEASRLNAESCCVCRTCKAPNPRADRDSALQCRACEAKRKATLEAAKAEWEKTRKPCAECDGAGYDDDDEDCDSCNGSGWGPMELSLDKLMVIVGESADEE